MYLPQELPNAHVLITVKTYPLPSSDHGEVVCTAGLSEDGKWIRMYPIASRIYDEREYPKYSWVQIDLIKHPHDKRLESYMPRRGLDEHLHRLETLGTEGDWAKRKTYVEREIFTSMTELIALSRSSDRSLATLRPKEIVDFVVEPTDREWKQQWLVRLMQLRMFEPGKDSGGAHRRPIRKLPYEFKYRFISEGDATLRTLSIIDWEIGSLFWKCLQRVHGDEEAAKNLVRRKYFDEFVSQKDLLLFLGTTYKFHMMKVDDPFTIVGVFYPPKTRQPHLF